MTDNLKENNVPQSELKKVDYNEKVLEVKNLKKHFFIGSGKGKITVPAVDDVSFDVYKREVFGLVGESGCGKTTTGRTIIKLYNATEGTVDLNGVRIGAGYHNHLAEIKRIKQQAKEDILSLDENKFKAIQLKKEADQKIEFLHEDIKKLKKVYADDLKVARKPIEDYKDATYLVRNQYQLDISNLKFNHSLKALEVKSKADNKYAIELNNELMIAKKTYLNKLDGLNDSAALTKETIDARIKDLKADFELQTRDLENKYRPLIEAETPNILPKAEAKAELKKMKAELNKAIQERKEKFNSEKSKISLPNTELVKENVLKVTNDFKAKLETIKSKIADVKAELKANVDRLPKSVAFNADQRAKAQEIRLKAKQDIIEQKQIIRDIKTVNEAQDTLKASQKMQMIFQDPISSLNPRMTVKEIIGEGLVIQGGYDSETISKMVAEVLEIVGLSPEYATRYPHEFSGGQRQRIGIARALIMNPNFIIADEPISALDVSIRAQVINLLTNLKEKLGLTILFIAHDLSVVRFFCDRIAVMYYGKIVELASSEELFNNPQHPYTISLLSAIPQPDPDSEKGRKRIHYNPSQHDYRLDKPSLREISKGHMVYANDKEFNEMKANYGKKKTSQNEIKA